MLLTRWLWFQESCQKGAWLPEWSIYFHISFRLPDAFSGAATTPFSHEITQVLMSPINETDVEIKPDGKLVLAILSKSLLVLILYSFNL